jgi:hypothetical protein
VGGRALRRSFNAHHGLVAGSVSCWDAIKRENQHWIDEAEVARTLRLKLEDAERAIAGHVSESDRLRGDLARADEKIATQQSVATIASDAIQIGLATARLHFDGSGAQAFESYKVKLTSLGCYAPTAAAAIPARVVHLRGHRDATSTYCGGSGNDTIEPALTTCSPCIASAHAQELWDALIAIALKPVDPPTRLAAALSHYGLEVEQLEPELAGYIAERGGTGRLNDQRGALTALDAKLRKLGAPTSDCWKPMTPPSPAAAADTIALKEQLKTLEAKIHGWQYASGVSEPAELVRFIKSIATNEAWKQASGVADPAQLAARVGQLRNEIDMLSKETVTFDELIQQHVEEYRTRTGLVRDIVRTVIERNAGKRIVANTSPPTVERYVRCLRSQVPDGARCAVCTTAESADYMLDTHEKSLAQGWAIQSLMHPLDAAARDDADNLRVYPWAVVDLASLTHEQRAAFEATLRGGKAAA